MQQQTNPQPPVQRGDERSHLDRDPASGMPIPIDPGTTDLGDDATRDVANRGGGLPERGESTIEGGLDPGNTDLGDDVDRPAD